MWSAIASLLLGVAGWLAASFFGKPLLDFLNLRGQVHEEVIFTANVGQMVANTCRLGAKLHATNVTTSYLLRWYLSIFGYDLAKAGGGLIGLSNSLGNIVGSRAFHNNSIQVGLKLPRD